MGGEFSYKVNLTSLTRQQAEFDAITQNALNNDLCTLGQRRDRQRRQLPAARHRRHLLARFRPRPTGGAPSSPTTAR